MTFSMRAGLHFEQLDGGFLVLVPGQTHVVHVTGDQANAFRLVRDGADTVPEHLESALGALIEAGIIETDALTRRRILALGGVGAAATIATIALTSIAAAASTPGTTTPGSTTTTIPPSPSNVYVADTNNNQIVKVDTGGTQTTIGSGFHTPWAVAIG